MKRIATFLLLLTLAVSGCAGLDASSDTAGPYRSVNRELHRQRAIIELAGGEAAVGVDHVLMSEHEISWEDEDGRHRAPTADVERVIVVSRRGPPAWGWWLLAGLGLSIAFDDTLPLEIAIDTALLAWEFGSQVPAEVGRIVYTAPR
jgi:hypothetical protein